MFRLINNIVLHHSASKIGTTIDEIRKWHVIDNGWSTIGYHYVIAWDGTQWRVYTCKPVICKGSHCIPRNADSIGICITGNFENIELPEEAYAELLDLCIRLCLRHNIDPLEITGHKDWDKTLCPGKNLYKEIPRLRMDVKTMLPLKEH